MDEDEKADYDLLKRYVKEFPPLKPLMKSPSALAKKKRMKSKGGISYNSHITSKSAIINKSYKQKMMLNMS